MARFLVQQGLDVSLERGTAQATGITAYDVLDAAQLGKQCDVTVVVGGVGNVWGTLAGASLIWLVMRPKAA